MILNPKLKYFGNALESEEIERKEINTHYDIKDWGSVHQKMSEGVNATLSY